MPFEDLLNKPNGARTIWADLAIKTPASPDYKEGEGFNPEFAESRKAIIQNIISSAAEKEIRLIGTADYNLGLEERGAWLDDLGIEGRKKGISVYPGLRVLLEEGVDLVFLFEPGKEQKELDEFLTEMGLGPGERFFRNNRPVPVPLPPREAVARARRAGGMVLLCINKTLKEHPALLADPWLWGVILPDDPDSLSPDETMLISGTMKGFERKLPLARVAGSFASKPKDVGSKKVSIKLGSHNLEGLRIALLDWKAKIRFPKEVEEPVYSKFLAAHWEGGFLDGLQIHFNPGFNAMIGGRGTGKTTIIETLRYALDEKPKTDRNKDNHEQVMRDVFLPGSKISLLVESHEPKPKRYLIERIYPFEPVVREAETGLKLSLNPKDVFRAEIFGNKEIYEISKHQDFQITLLERLATKELSSFREEENSLIEKLEKQSTEILSLSAELSKRDAELAKLPATEEKLTRFLEMDIPAKIEEKRSFEQEGHAFERGEAVLADIKKMLLGLIGETSSRLRSLQDESASTLNQELLGEYKNTMVEFVAGFERNVQDLIASLQDTEASHRTFFKQWEKLYLEGEERFQESLRALQDRFPGIDVNEFITLEKEAMRLRERKVERDVLSSRLSMRRDERRALIERLFDIRKSRFSILAERVSRWNADLGGKIRIELSPKGDPERSAVEIRKLVPSISRENALQIVNDDNFSFKALAESARSGDRDALSAMLKLGPGSLPPSFDEETISRMEMVDIPPKVAIQLNLGSKKEPRYRDVGHLSDGQRCTAILGILMLTSPYPLIVDQPEEDLDNAFIVEEIADRFRSEMDKRQFLVATHNANIPVLGDAAQILALEADVDHSYLLEGRYGYLDSPVIKEVVERILEGGREAFEIRKEKYGL
ncbi:hypothetical protein GX441_07860 [bacterium]|nr:hypothetical protein [bacterium]